MNRQHDQLNVMVSIQGTGHYPGSWRHPLASPALVHSPHYYHQLAQTAERGKLDLLYWDEPRLDPLTWAASLAAVTDYIGIGASVTTELIEPYTIARSLAALDHFSDGRAAWYAGASSQHEPQRNLNAKVQTSEQLLERKQEFIEVTEQLWESWDKDACIVDRETGRFYDGTKVHRIHHSGKYFKVRGPLSIPRPPQGRPVRISFTKLDGTHAADIGNADVIVTSRTSLAEAIAFKAQYSHVKVFTSIIPILGETEEQAHALASELLTWKDQHVELLDNDLFIGTPLALADWMEEWFKQGGSDGFNIQPAILPLGLDQFVDQVVPILQDRGLFRNGYTEPTLRGHLGLMKEVVR